MQSKKTENAEYWPKFVALITQDNKYLDYFPDHGFVGEVPPKEIVFSWLSEDYKTALKILKPKMQASQHKRLAAKYANYKYNKKNQRSTFTINEVTINRLSQLLKLHALDNYNELIEYLTQPDNATQELLKQFAAENPKSGLDLDASFKVFIKKLQAEQSALVKTMMQDVYMQAWKDCLKSSGSHAEMEKSLTDKINQIFK